MYNYMVTIINGGKDDDGDLVYLGPNFNFKYHAECLIDYALKKYPNISGFKEIDYMDEPNLPIYYLSILNNIIFTNVSVDEEKRGILYLPKNISSKQQAVLFDFIKTISDYEIYIVYNMSLIDGMFMGTQFQTNEKMELSNMDLLKNFFDNNLIVKRDSLHGKKKG